MKDFLVITAVFPPEPVVSASISYDICLELSKSYNVKVFAPKPTRPSGFKFTGEILSHPFTLQYSRSYTSSESSFVKRFIESWSFGISSFLFILTNRNNVEGVYLNTWPIFGQFFAAWACRLCSLQLTVHVQDLYPEALRTKVGKIYGLCSSVLLPIDKFVMSSSKNVIVISERMKAHVVQSRSLSLEKVNVVHNWQNPELFHLAGFRGIDEPFTFMYLGNIGPLANLDFLIRTFSSAALKNTRLIIAGSGSKKDDLLKLVTELKTQNVEFIEVPAGKVSEVQSLADVLVLPVMKGGAASSVPSKLPAYMFSRKPVLASIDLDSESSEVITSSGCGRAVKAGDSVDLIKALIEMRNLDKSALEEFGNNGYEYAIENFSKIKNIQRIMNLLKS